MRNMEIKLIKTENSSNAIKDVLALIAKHLESPLSGRSIKMSDTIDTQELSSILSKKYDCSIHDGVTGGCYGSRDGSSFPGLTVWMHAKEFTDRYVDSEYGEQVNPWHLLNEYGTLLNDVDGEQFLEIIDSADIEYKSDNTYNYQGTNSEDAGFFFDFQFDHVVLKDAHFLVCMFHCGGDPRGNYTDKLVWKFTSEDDLYSCLFPSKMLSDNE